MDSNDSSLIKQHFSATIFQSYFDYVHEFYPHIDMSALCTAAGLNYEFVMNENNWVSCVFNQRLMKALGEAIPDPDFQYKVGRYAVSKRGLGSALYALARNVFEIDYIYGNLWRLSGLLNKMMKFELVAKASGRVRLKITPLYAGLSESEAAALKEGLPHVIQNIAGYYSALPRLKEMPDAVVEVTTNDDHYYFDIAFKAESFRRLEAVGAGLLSIAAGAVAEVVTGEIPWAVTASVLGMSLYGVAIGRRMITRLKSTAEHLENNMEIVNDQYRRLQSTQEELDRRFMEAKALNAVSSHLTASEDELTVLRDSCRDLAEILKFDRVLILLKNAEGTTLELRAGHDTAGALPKFMSDIKFEINIASQDITKISNVFRQRSPILIKNVVEHLPTLNEESRRALVASGSKSFVAIPIASEVDSFGVLLADNYHSDRRLSESDVEVLMTTGRQIAVVLQKLRAQSRLAAAYIEIESLANSYSRFVPFKLIDLIGFRTVLDINLKAGKEYEMAVVFSDIRSFTTMSEKMDPAETVSFLNSYFGSLAPVFELNGGVIDKFVGDGIMALFLEPGTAIRAAVEFQRRLAIYNQTHRSGMRKSFINAGVGIHFGKVLLGAVGYENRMSISVTSDAVNLASRIEGLNKQFGVDLLCSEEVVERLSNRDGVRFVGKIKVKGRQSVTELYEIIEHLERDHAVSRKAAEPALRNIVSMIEQGQYPQARMLLDAALTQFQVDPVLRYYDNELENLYPTEPQAPVQKTA